MNNDWVYDTETYPNVFLFAAQHVEMPFSVMFEISHRRNECAAMIAFIDMLRNTKSRMVGFNNIGFDYPVVHLAYRSGNTTAEILYAKAQAIFSSQDDEFGGRWQHRVKPSDCVVPQVDLFLIHHFDNKSKSTGLKALEFAMKSDTIEDLPFPPGTVLTDEQIDFLRGYNRHDISETRKFYWHTIDMLRFRDELTVKYQMDCTNYNDTKIGKEYFIIKLEEAGIPCYEFSNRGRTPRQTKRPVICLNAAILPWIKFEHPELTRVLQWLREQNITETKGVFKDLTATVNGFTFVFGTGGIHGSIENTTVVSDDEFVVVDDDVTSYYPNLAIKNKFFPAHLGIEFCSIYETLFEQRKTYNKKSAESGMLKLALNGVYGDSNNQFSVFYDPLFTMSITLNGQLLLCMLAEQLMKIPQLQMIQANTDGITYRVPRKHKATAEAVCKWWQNITGMNLEETTYKAMMIRDVNNYVAQFENGSVKRKGAYEWKTQWHQDASALVVPKVAEKVLLEGASIRDTVKNWPDLYDFMIRVKVPRSSHLSVEKNGQMVKVQNTTRFLVAKNGDPMFKWMPPLKGKTEWRKMAVKSGWKVHVCNDIADAAFAEVDHEFYIQEVEKLCLQLS